MEPTYSDGDIVSVDLDAYSESPPAPQDIVLACHPFKRDTFMVKRVRELTPDGRVFVVGDDLLHSTDSRSLGPLKPELILGRVVGKHA